MTRRMRALLTAFHYPPEVSGGVPRMLSIEKYLAASGAEVTLVTPQPTAKSPSGSNILHVPFPGYYSEPSASPQRPLHRRIVKKWLLMPDVFITWAASAAQKVASLHRRRPFDLVITSSPPESMHLFGLKLKSLGSCAWLADFCDGWTFEPLREEGALPLRSEIEHIMEALVVRRADFITAATRPIASDLTGRYRSTSGKVMWLPPAFEAFQMTSRPLDRSHFHLVYTGRFSKSHPQRTPAVFFAGLARALGREPAKASRFRLTLMGDFTEAEQALACSGKVAAVAATLPAVSHEKALELSASATMLLLVTTAGATSVATRKLFDYLSVRRPVFALAEGNEAERIISETRSGVCVSPTSAAAVAEGLVRVFRLWHSGRLESAFPGDMNHLYLAAPHLKRTLGKVLTLLSHRTAPAT